MQRILEGAGYRGRLRRIDPTLVSFRTAKPSDGTSTAQTIRHSTVNSSASRDLICCPYHSVTGMFAYISGLVSWLAGRFRSRAELELEVIALRHQLAVLRRQRPSRPWLSALDRLLWIWLYRVWPRCLNIMVLVKPATVVQWHRQGFRLYWRWRSRSGRPSIGREVRDLIRQMNKANPLWSAPRIHGELLKLGIEVSQATVAKYMVRGVGTPSPRWRNLRNEAIGIAAIDTFVAVSASCRLLYVMVILAHGRREIVRFDVTEHPLQRGLRSQELSPTGTFCCTTATTRTARSSASGSRRWASLRSSRHHAHRGRTPTSSG